MKTITFETREEWLEARLGKISGSRLKDIIVKRAGLKKKIGFYELIAERIALPASDESPMDRGNRLEKEAVEKFTKKTKKKVNTDLVIWQRDDDESIIISPDGVIGKTEAVEVKCLSSARHIEAWLIQGVPSDYTDQVLQYFIVNDDLKILYFVFYDDRMPGKDFFYFKLKRESFEEQIKKYLEQEREILAEVIEIVNKLTNF